MPIKKKQISGTKRGRKPEINKGGRPKTVVKKQTRKLSAEEKERRRATLERNRAIASEGNMKSYQRDRELKKLTVEEQIAKKKENIAKSTNIAEKTRVVEEVCKELGYDPLREMITAAKKRTTKPSEKIMVAKYVGDKLYPSLKAIDMQADMNMNVSVQLVSFAAATTDQMKKAHSTADKLKDEDYEEFEDKVIDV